MDAILGILKKQSQGTLKEINVRLAYMNTWNKRITIARDAAGLTKTKLAKQVGVSNAAVSDWESGVIKKLESENLLKICEVLEISPRWLQFGEGQMSEKYIDPKIQAVIQAMQDMPDYKKDILVQTSTALAEQTKPKNNGTQ